LIDNDGQSRVVAEGLGFCNGVILSPDQAFLYTCDMRGKTVYSFQIQSDGSLAHGEPLYDLHLPPEGTETSADGMTVDTNGRLYVATNVGVQVCDPLGRVQLILAKPDDQWLANLVFDHDG
jgi:sugar lactone lactonase YvrE